MIRSLYTRLVAFQFLLVVLESFLFWLTAVVFDVPEPMSLIIVAVCGWAVAAVVIGLLLHPLEQVLLALKHLAAGEDVPLRSLRGPEGQAMEAALNSLRERFFAKSLPARPEPAMPGAVAGTATQRDVLDSLSEGILIVDAEMRPLLTNSALRTMASVDAESSGEHGPAAYRYVFHARCFVPDQLAFIEDEMKKMPERPRTDIVQLEHPRQFLRRYGAPLRDDTGAQTGFLVSYQDITHEVEQDRLRQDFIANASHELRTPVTSVKLLLENLVDGAKDDLSVRDDFLDDALREIDRMHDLVNDLLDIAALEAGRHNLQLTQFPLSQVLNEAIATVAPQATQREVTLSADLPNGEITLHADRTRLRQVLVNLVANAVKFTPAQGTVTAKAWIEGEHVKLAISDTGIGIPAQDLPHIFDRFFRVTRGRSRLQGGSGLGLTIVKTAVDAHRGDINIESTEGQGTTVYITLPLKQDPA